MRGASQFQGLVMCPHVIQCPEEEATGPLCTGGPTESPDCGWPAPATVWSCSSWTPGRTFTVPSQVPGGLRCTGGSGLGPALQTPSLGHPFHRCLAGCVGVCPPLPLPPPTAVECPPRFRSPLSGLIPPARPSCALPVPKSSPTCRPVPHPAALMTPLNPDGPSLLSPPSQPLRVGGPSRGQADAPHPPPHPMPAAEPRSPLLAPWAALPASRIPGWPSSP